MGNCSSSCDLSSWWGLLVKMWPRRASCKQWLQVQFSEINSNDSMRDDGSEVNCVEFPFIWHSWRCALHSLATSLVEEMLFFCPLANYLVSNYSNDWLLERLARKGPGGSKCPPRVVVPFFHTSWETPRVLCSKWYHSNDFEKYEANAFEITHCPFVFS